MTGKSSTGLKVEALLYTLITAEEGETKQGGGSPTYT